MSVTLRIYGVPAPQGSKTAFVRSGRAVLVEGKGPGRAAHAAWRQAVATAARDHLGEHDGPPFTTACAVAASFLLPKPPSSPKKRRHPDSRPDLDKLQRSLLDGLADGGLLSNDSRVVEIHAAKSWASEGQAPGAIVTICDADDLDDQVETGRSRLPLAMRNPRAV